MKVCLAENIRMLRKERGLTQEQLAEAMGITVGTVSKWETGSCVPDVSLMMELAEFFETSVDVLLGYERQSTALEDRLEGVRNYCVTARKQGGGVIFLRRVIPGAADESYGVEVASLAGVPKSVVERARDCLRELDEGARGLEPPAAADAAPGGQLTLGGAAEDEVVAELRRVKLEAISPIEAMNVLYALQRKLEQ